MDTLVDASEQQTTRRSSSRMKADAPRHTLPSVADAEVQWFARTGAFPRSTPTPPPPPKHDLESGERRHEARAEMRLDDSGLDESDLVEADLDEDDLDDDTSDALAEDVALDSFSTEADASDPENDTLVLATRPFVRARIWSSED